MKGKNINNSTITPTAIDIIQALGLRLRNAKAASGIGNGLIEPARARTKVDIVPGKYKLVFSDNKKIDLYELNYRNLGKPIGINKTDEKYKLTIYANNDHLYHTGSLIPSDPIPSPDINNLRNYDISID